MEYVCVACGQRRFWPDYRPGPTLWSWLENHRCPTVRARQALEHIGYTKDEAQHIIDTYRPQP